MSDDILIFSYGTLQQPEVQQAQFGRLIAGEPDALPGYRLDRVAIDDPAVVATSAAAVHPIVVRTGAPEDVVTGTVFRISAAELAAADGYETSAYERVEVALRSGRQAWVYAAPQPGAGGPLLPLERGQLRVMQVRGGVTALILLGLAGVGAAILQDAQDVPAWLILVPALVLAAYVGLVSPGRRYRAWGYRVDSEELRLAHGVYTQVETLVPLKRVQHLDIAQGPLERSCGVCRLMLHTAGTANSLVVLPGLSRDTAEAMRADIRARVRREPE